MMNRTVADGARGALKRSFKGRGIVGITYQEIPCIERVEGTGDYIKIDG